MKERGQNMENNIEIFIIPDYDTIRESLGLDEYEAANPDMMEVEQGLAVDPIEIADDNTFEIPEGYYGQIKSDHEFFELIEFDENQFAKEPLSRIAPGRYKIEGDSIRKIYEENDSWF